MFTINIMTPPQKTPQELAQEAAESAQQSAAAAKKALDDLKTAVETAVQFSKDALQAIGADLETPTVIDIDAKKDRTEDSYQLRITKLETYISRSKWLLGVYGGLIVIMGNDIFKGRVFCQVSIVSLCIIGATILALAIVKFEQQLVVTKRAVQTGAKESDKIGKDVKMYGKALGLLKFNMIYTLFLGLLFLSFLIFKLDLKLGSLAEGNETRNAENKTADGAAVSSFTGTYSFISKGVDKQCDTVVSSLKLNPDRSFELSSRCRFPLKNPYKSSLITGKWEVGPDSVVHLISSDNKAFNLKLHISSYLRFLSKEFKDSLPYLYKEE
ncbi:MAG: hypothetical protein J7502_02970 [Flavisolibacter sp.]|nr:hypothetical protein [Flavisolibacter sp.]